jgi:cytokinin dehydrogenase
MSGFKAALLAHFEAVPRNVPGDLSSVAADVREDGATLRMAARDWGHIVAAWPRVVVRPASVADIAATIRFAAAGGVPVAARGAGHSPFGQGQVAGGVVVDMTSLRAIHEVTAGQLVVDAGARWRDVVAGALRHGLTPPVLPDYLELTVGGTLSVGGIGGATHQHGAQTDTVVELEVVTGTGQVLRCSPTHDAALFDAMRAGLAQCGVITRATLRVVPARPRARRWRLSYGSFGAFLADQRTAVRHGRFDYLEGQAVLDEETGRWRYVLEATAYYSPSRYPKEPVLLSGLGFERHTLEVEDTTYLEFLDRMRPGEELLRAEGSWFHPHPWLTLFLPDDSVGAIVAETLARTNRADLGDSGLVLLYPLRADRLRTPLLRVPAGELVWLFAMLRTGNGDPATTARMIELNGALHRLARSAGGTVYPVNALPMTSQDWRAHLGTAWDSLATAKNRYDPAGILAPGQSLFARSPGGHPGQQT